MAYSQEDRYEIAYMRWVINDGPRKATNEHMGLANSSLILLMNDGWRVLENRMVKTAESEIELTEVVIRKGNVIHLLRWNTFNKGWMRDTGHGWIIFNT